MSKSSLRIMFTWFFFFFWAGGGGWGRRFNCKSLQWSEACNLSQLVPLGSLSIPEARSELPLKSEVDASSRNSSR